MINLIKGEFNILNKMIFNYIVGTFQGTRDIEENRRLEVNFRDSKQTRPNMPFQNVLKNLSTLRLKMFS